MLTNDLGAECRFPDWQRRPLMKLLAKKRPTLRREREKSVMKKDNSPRLLSISDELASTVVVVGVSAVLVADRPRHFFLCHRTLCVYFGLSQCEVVIQLNLSTGRLHLICHAEHTPSTKRLELLPHSLNSKYATVSSTQPTGTVQWLALMKWFTKQKWNSF